MTRTWLRVSAATLKPTHTPEIEDPDAFYEGQNRFFDPDRVRDHAPRGSGQSAVADKLLAVVDKLLEVADILLEVVHELLAVVDELLAVVDAVPPGFDREFEEAPGNHGRDLSEVRGPNPNSFNEVSAHVRVNDTIFKGATLGQCQSMIDSHEQQLKDRI